MSLKYDMDASLGQSLFSRTELGDQRHTARLVKTFNQMQRHPGGTLPEKLSIPANLRACYLLYDDDEVTHAALPRSLHRPNRFF